jgi:glycosyltransferase involved in cell wall biosynthesis
MNKKLISVIVPAYNEEDCIEELARRLQNVFDSHPKYDFEAIIVENGSEDRTWEMLNRIHSNDPRFNVIQLSRNFRMDGGITAGLNHATGDAAVIMTADLQDPPELISEFLEKWEEGNDNIYMIVTKRTDAGLIRSFNSRLFYWIAGKLTDNRIPKNASDFRLVDRTVYEAVRSMDERNRFVRGLFAWVGFRSVGIPHERPERFGGDSKAHTLKVIDLAIKGLLAHSVLPLRMISIFGAILSAASVVVIALLTAFWVLYGVPYAGFGTLVSLIVLLFGLLFLIIGVVSEYLGMVYEEVKGRPNFIVRQYLGLNNRGDT